MKYSQILGIGAAVVCMAACLFPWAYYPDLDKTFNGFFSQENQYGKPGKFIWTLCLLSMALFLIPRIWAKRLHVFVAALLIAFSFKTFFLFTACYRGTCPQARTALYVEVAAALVLVFAALTPKMILSSKKASKP